MLQTQSRCWFSPPPLVAHSVAAVANAGARKQHSLVDKQHTFRLQLGCARTRFGLNDISRTKLKSWGDNQRLGRRGLQTRSAPADKDTKSEGVQGDALAVIHPAALG